MGDPPDYSDDYEDDYIEWADPAIRASYEATLGRFILQFNEVDYRLTVIIQRALAHLDPLPGPGFRALAQGDFATRCRNVMLLQKLPQLQQISGYQFEELVSLSGIRNLVAHGHFDQDPWSGDFSIKSWNRQKAGQRGTHLPTETLAGYADKLQNWAGRLHTADTFWRMDLLPLDTTAIDWG